MFRLESNTSKRATGGTLFQYQQGQWVFIGYLSENVLWATQNNCVTGLELTDLVSNVQSVSYPYLYKNVQSLSE